MGIYGIGVRDRGFSRVDCLCLFPFLEFEIHEVGDSFFFFFFFFLFVHYKI